MAVAAAGSGCASMGAPTPVSPRASEAEQTRTFRVLAYNIKHGEGMDRVIDLERIARVIKAVEPDLVALQEVDSMVERTGRVDQTSVLGEMTGMHSVFGTFFDYQGGRYGMALLSKYPFVSYTNHLLPKGVEHRAALAGTVRLGVDGPEIIVVGIHLVWTGEEKLSQAVRLTEIFADEARPVILAGDFNSLPDSDVMGLLRGHWQIAAKDSAGLTFPADAPDREIDYIMYRPRDRFEVVSHRVIDERLASDHRPLLLELRLK